MYTPVSFIERDWGAGEGNGFIKQCKVMTTRIEGVVQNGVAEGWFWRVKLNDRENWIADSRPLL